MCGIFGIIKKNLYEANPHYLLNDLKLMLNLSALRGAQGIGIGFLNNEKFQIHRENTYIKKFINNIKFKYEILNILKSQNKIFSIFGQTRLPIIGDKIIKQNNAPIETKELIGIHNGNIIYKNLNFNNLEFSKKSDSRILFEDISKIYRKHENKFETVMIEYLKKLKGEYNIMIYLKHEKCFYIGSNTGSIYYYENFSKKDGFIVFLSENYFMKQFKKKSNLFNFEITKIKNLKNKFIKIDDSFNLVQIKL